MTELIVCAIPVSSLAELLAKAEAPKKRKTQPLDPTSGVGLVEMLVRARAWLEKADVAVSGQHGHDVSFRVIERVVRGFELNDDEALTALEVWNARCDPPWSETELRHKIKDGRERGDTLLGELRDEPRSHGATHTNGAPPGVTPPASWASKFIDPRPTIHISSELHLNVDESVLALGADKNLYQRDGKLVHVTRVSLEESQRSAGVVLEDGTVRRSLVEGSPQIRETTIATLRERLTTYAQYRKYNERARGWKDSLPTDPIVAAALARGEWRGIRPIVGIVEAPTLRPDGSVVQDAGYDDATGYLYVPSEEFPKVDESPVLDDARDALRELLDVFVDFPYVTEAHRSVPIAAILTLIARPAVLGATPAFLFDASTRGSGKTLQTDAIATIVTGRGMPRMNYPHDEDELEKVLGSYALRGAPFFSLDNVTRSFGGGAIDRVITARDTVDLRILGKSEVPTLPWRAVVLATGNNLTLFADTARRVLIARIEPKEEKPEGRTNFEHEDLPAWVQRERGRLVVAALTILRAYFVAGRPVQKCERWGSFEEWSRLIPQAIVWAGGEDPMGSRPTQDSDVDDEAASMQVVIDGLRKLFVAHPFKTHDVIDLLFRTPREKNKETGFLVPDGYDVLREAIIDVCRPRPGTSPDSRSLGKRLSRYRGRIMEGKKLTMTTVSGGIGSWKVTKSEDDDEESTA